MRTGAQVIKFLAVGLLNTVIHYTAFLLLFRGLGVHYLAASTLGYGLGLLNSYILNRTWTFRSAGGRLPAEVGKFLAVNALALALNLGGLKYLVLVHDMPPELAQAGALCLSTCANFLGNKFWVFAGTSRSAC